MNGSNFCSAPLPKRKRLSYACNYCRAKKTRCDEQFPSCRNCQLAGVSCITVNKRRPNAPVQNRRKDLPSLKRPLETEAPRVTAIASPETSCVSPSSLSGPELSIAPARLRSLSPGPGSIDGHQWSTPSWDTRHLPVMPTRAGSSMVHNSTQWLDLALSRLGIPLSSFVRMDLRPCLSSPSTLVGYPIPCVEPSLPPFEELQKLTELFFKVHHPVYPFLDHHYILALLDVASDEVRSDNRARTCGKVPRLMLLYLITILGYMANPQASHRSLSTYLAYCHTLIGHLLLEPALESVQALLLFSITLRLRDQLSQAWDVLTLAISMSHTLRLGDLSVYPQSVHQIVPDGDKDISRTWWALYVFEKFLAFDSGRKSYIEDPKLGSLGRQDSQKLPEQAENPKVQSYEYCMTHLANVLREMQHQSWHTWRKESLEATTEEEARASKIRAAGEIDTLLCKWRRDLPPEHQIGTSSAADVQLAPQWSFLSFYYYQAIIVLYRNALLLDWNELKWEADQFGSGEIWHPRLRKGPQICLEAAKEMTNLQVMVTEAGDPTFLYLATSPLAAAYVLAIYIRRQPASILSRTHSELMKAALTISRQRYPSGATQSLLHKHLDTLEQHIAEILADTARLSSIELCPQFAESNVHSFPLTSAAPSNPLEPSFAPWETFEWMSWDWNEIFPQN
ncbi:hypothetical protein PEBR_30048 [Penicillium brasilianum]|uniref:Zn(2)-C6 fungal-type domain-containing protein n=1 Tax=Penicillium brasilianum TaxID=104259 RepID=A0A1S9RGT3_PENBI|nr:hypothetical protein PEBR_30048 [Penicillium brasilianum]